MEDLTPGQAAVLARNERMIEQTMVSLSAAAARLS